MFEQSIDKAYHLGGITRIGTTRQRFGNDEPPAILERLKILYGTPILQEIDHALLRLHNSMDCNQPAEVMFRKTEGVHMFLMAHPDGDHELSFANIISYAMIKLSKCGGLYKKSIKR